MALSYMEETTLKTVAARLAIGDLNARHNRAYETGDLHAWLGTFVVEGVLERAGHDPVEGHQALAAVFRDAPRDRVHLVTDSQVEVDGVRARQVCRFVVLKAGSNGSDVAVEAAGRYEDELVYERAAWYIVKRSVVRDLPASG